MHRLLHLLQAPAPRGAAFRFPLSASLLALGLSLGAGGTRAAPALGPPPDAAVRWFGLDPFYRKHVTVGGLPILGSAKANDTTLLEAARILSQVLAGEKGRKVIDALIRNKVRVAVMAASENTTDIPEHRTLEPAGYWDKRARGLGATRARPIVTTGEENLLNRRGDRYAGENILIHEFAHAIHQMGLRYIDSTFEPALLKAYDQAMKAGLWAGQYAAVNEAEYWAEGVQSWFNANLSQAGGPAGADQHAALAAYDPGLAALIGRVFESSWRYTPYAKRAPQAYAPEIAVYAYDSLRYPPFAEKQSPTVAVPLDAGDRAAVRAVLDANGLFGVDPDGVVEKNSYGRATGLYVAHRGLTSLPPDIGKLSALKFLHLYGNSLTVLPPEIGQLASLESLLLTDNALIALPAEIGKLPHLKELILDDNRLSALPASLGSLRETWFLMLNGNRLTALPDTLGSMSSILILSLEDNRLTALPAGLTALRPASQLLADRNALCAVPPDQQKWLDTYSYDAAWNATQRCGSPVRFARAHAGRMRVISDPVSGRLEVAYPRGAVAGMEVTDLKGRRLTGSWDIRPDRAIWTPAPGSGGAGVVRARAGEAASP